MRIFLSFFRGLGLFGIGEVSDFLIFFVKCFKKVYFEVSLWFSRILKVRRRFYNFFFCLLRFGFF